MSYCLGIDFGTSGARLVALSQRNAVDYQAESKFTNQGTKIWQDVLNELIAQVPSPIRATTVAITINGTSATVLICDGGGNPLDEPILYNDSRGVAVLAAVQALAPPEHLVNSASSSFAKLIWWSGQPIFAEARYFLHQADWLGFLLHGRLGYSDYHNALKLGYDVVQLRYPDWLQSLPFFGMLPQVLVPGEAIAPVTSEVAARLQLPKTCLVCGGTTDSIAAFLASGGEQPGTGVTSLGSTLAIKLLSHRPVEALRYGIYSHRLGNLWLTGGASNTGGAVLRHFFSNEELVSLSAQIDPNQASPLDYYPLLKKGDRFPTNDPELVPRLEPRPDDPVAFLQGLLESMARIEARGYELLKTLGASPLERVYTAGGGAKNAVWQQIRQRYLNVPLLASPHTDAAYGTACLAWQGYRQALPGRTSG